jgi:hypothetical protein
MEKDSISILCYTLENNSLDSVGLVNDNNYLKTIEAETEEDDSSLLRRAKQILKKDFDFELENDKWKFLGEIKTSKSGHVVYSFALNITDVTLPGIKMQSLNAVTKLPDAVTQAAFFRLFSSLYKKDILQ